MKMKLATFLSAILLTTAFVGEASAYSAYATTTLNVRSGPGTNYQVITSLGRGQRVDVVGCSGSWCEIDLGRGQGFASASYLSGANAGRSYAPPPPVVVVPQPYYVQRYDYYDRRNYNYRDDHRYRGRDRGYRRDRNEQYRRPPVSRQDFRTPGISRFNGDSGMTLQQQHERNSSN